MNGNHTSRAGPAFRAFEAVPDSIAGDGDTDLNIYVCEANGNLITRSVGLSERETVSFMPNVTSTFRIEVRNYGNGWIEFANSMRTAADQKRWSVESNSRSAVVSFLGGRKVGLAAMSPLRSR